MRRLLFVAVAAAVLPLIHPIAATAHADVAPAPPPPYIDHTEWVHWADLSSLRVYPTPAGREASTDFVSSDEAWSEVSPTRLTPTCPACAISSYVIGSWPNSRSRARPAGIWSPGGPLSTLRK